MILSHDEIAKRLRGEGPDDERLEISPLPDLQALLDKPSASVDLRLGTWFLVARTSRATHFDPYTDELPEYQFVRRMYTPLGQPFVLHPHEFVLAATLEWISMPKGLSGYVTGKSSWGRRGLVIETAPGVHPRYTGCITLELANVGEIPIKIMPGSEICQLFLHRVFGEPVDTPPGSFACRRQPTLGTIRSNPLITALLKGN
jgi:dCTP deaminase